MAAMRFLGALILAWICLSSAQMENPYIFVAGPYGVCTNTVTKSTACNSEAAPESVKTREVYCIRRGSYGLKLPSSFCATFGSTTIAAPKATMPCALPQCQVNTPSPQAVAKAPIKCQNNIVAYNSRIQKANITIYSAGETSQGTGMHNTMLFPTDFKMSVIQPVFAGPVVLSYTLYKCKDTTCKANEMVVAHQGEKVGQAMTNNSYVMVDFEDLAEACSTQTKGRGMFAVTMNQIKPPKAMSVDPSYFSRQKLTWYWPTAASDFPIESPDSMMVQGFPYTIANLMWTKTPTFQVHKYVYGKNPMQAASYPKFMDLRFLKD